MSCSEERPPRRTATRTRSLTASPEAAGSVATAPRASGGAGTAEESYQAAYLDFSKGLYPLSVSGFRDFLRRFPDSALAEHRQVLAAIRRLPARQREVLVLRFYLDLDEEEIAASMRISRGTVKSTTSRALAALGRILGEQQS